MYRFIFSLFFLLLLIPFASAFGVSPATLDFGDVNPGGFAERSVLLSGLDGAAVEVIPGRWSAAPSEVSVVGSERVALSVEPPDDAAPGEYVSVVRFRLMPSAEAGGVKRSLVAYELAVPYTFTVIGERSAACVIGGVSLSASEQGRQAALSYSIKNSGSVRIEPIFSLSLESGGRTLFVEEWVDDELLPSLDAVRVRPFRQSLPPGDYVATLRSPTCGYEGSFEAVVAEPGSLSRSGELQRLEAGREEGFTPVDAFFRNTGEQPVSARLSGVVVDDQERIVAVIESEPLLVLPGERVTLQEVVALPDDAAYRVRAKVLYEGSVSEEREIAVAALEPAPAGRSWFLPLLFGVVIIVLLVLIIEKKRR